MKIGNLRVCYQTKPLALEEEQPLFSWELTNDRNGTSQIEYRILVHDDEKLMWDSGQVCSDETLGLAYEGIKLQPQTTYTWQVMVKNNYGENAVAESSFRMGYLGTSWVAPFISAETEQKSSSSPRMRYTFLLDEIPVEAYATVYAPCWFQVYVNGERPDDRQLTPVATPDEGQIYEVYDLAECLEPGENVIGLWLGDGYDQNFIQWGWRYKGAKRVTMELRLKYKNGQEQLLTTDENWRVTTKSAIIYNSVYHGETYDARLNDGWCEADYDDSEWDEPFILGKPERKLTSRYIPDIRVTEHTEPVTWWRTQDGKLLLDYGQNRGGWVRLRLKGKSGEKVILRFSEEINRDTGELDPFTNRTARATDTYIFSGEGIEEYEPHFTYHGFRYVEVSGWDGPVLPGYFTACTLHCDFRKVGEFTCDDPSINRLMSNILWGIRSNAVSYPTDCPMRDERTPCQHDVVVYFDIASQMFDAGLYFRQFAENTLVTEGNSGWGGAQITIAWFLYNWFGDKQYVERCYDTLKVFMHKCEEDFPEVCDRYFGDWCAPKENADGGYECAFSYVDATCTALMYYQAWEYAQLAEIMGDDREKQWAEARMKAIACSYNQHFYDEVHGWYDEGEQTAAVLPLYFGMVPEERHSQIVQSVVDGIERKAGHIDTGIYGTKYLPLAMAREGYLDVVLDAFFHKDYPSYGYEFSCGATTVWEQFMERGEMASHNHGMFGGGGTFILENLAGFSGVENAGKKINIKPILSKRVRRLKCTVGTPRGCYTVNYVRKRSRFTMTVTVPVGCVASVTLPDASSYICEHGDTTLSCVVE